jgi:hypothetical protein
MEWVVISTACAQASCGIKALDNTKIKAAKADLGILIMVAPSVS